MEPHQTSLFDLLPAEDRPVIYPDWNPVANLLAYMREQVAQGIDPRPDRNKPFGGAAEAGNHLGA
jgi:hypothetical protein